MPKSFPRLCFWGFTFDSFFLKWRILVFWPKGRPLRCLGSGTSESHLWHSKSAHNAQGKAFLNMGMMVVPETHQGLFQARLPSTSPLSSGLDMLPRSLSRMRSIRKFRISNHLRRAKLFKSLCSSCANVKWKFKF